MECTITQGVVDMLKNYFCVEFFWQNGGTEDTCTLQPLPTDELKTKGIFSVESLNPMG